MFFKKFFLVLLLISSSQIVFCASWKMYKVVDTIPIKKSSNPKKLYKDVQEWFKSEKNVKIVRLNGEQLIIEGKGFLVYYNHVIVENVFLSPHAAERSTGSIVYNIRITIMDSIVVAEATNFVHEAYYNQYGVISFGVITDYETVPPGKCMEHEIWCNSVWEDMKSRINTEISDKFSRLISPLDIRKQGKAFKTEEEIAPTPVDDKKNEDYLKLDNYLIKE